MENLNEGEMRVGGWDIDSQKWENTGDCLNTFKGQLGENVKWYARMKGTVDKEENLGRRKQFHFEHMKLEVA